MEPNNSKSTIAKKIWHMVRVVIFMLKKGITKTKLLSNLNLMMKGGKIAGKAIHNLMFHHPHHTATTPTTTHRHLDEYEFSCSNTPKHYYPFTLFKRKHHHNHFNQFWLENVRTDPQSPALDNNEHLTPNAVMKALEMLQSEAASPALPGFGRSPVAVKQLKITDSPFPLNCGDDEDNNNEVDEAADEFIKKFYKNLRKQNLVAPA